MKRATISFKGLGEELCAILQESGSNVSSVVNRALIEAFKNPDFVNTILLEEVSTKNEADKILELINVRMGDTSSKKKGQTGPKKDPFN